MTQQSYPVLIECTEYRIVWVEAEDAKEAAGIVAEDGEWISSSESYDSDWKASEPDEWGWQDIYGYGSAARNQDAHVEAHKAEMWRRKREAEKAACTEAGHPDLGEPLGDGRAFCPGCHEYLPAAS